jgi:PiT family inorganic phosphate transporter
MATTASSSVLEAKISYSPGQIALALFALVLVIGAGYAAWNLLVDLASAPRISVTALILLGVALFTALGFEFVNGFHDTANAVATVIYTHALEPHVAVVWSGFWNFLGVLLSSGAVAFGIISLLPVELILKAGSGAGLAMVFALLLAAILWNLGTWYLGLPASSSHTLIGSIIGVGIANQLMVVTTGTSGVDWAQAANVGKSLLLSPLVGFVCAGLLLLARQLIPDERLYRAPEGGQPPPFWIRALLILTCTGVSFAHGSNDGQKGMGLIMLILVGVVPTAYALNRAVTAEQTQDFVAVSQQAVTTLHKYVEPGAVMGDPTADVTEYIASRHFKPGVTLALQQLVNDLSNEVAQYKALVNVPVERVRNFRNDMYLVSEAPRRPPICS